MNLIVAVVIVLVRVVWLYHSEHTQSFCYPSFASPCFELDIVLLLPSFFVSVIPKAKPVLMLVVRRIRPGKQRASSDHSQVFTMITVCIILSWH